MSNPIPGLLALTSIADGSAQQAAPIRNNYSAIQTAANEIIAALNSGAVGQPLLSAGATALQWGPKTTTSPLAGGPPGSPADQDIWIATNADANGARWAFQYNAGSASASKWEFIGGGSVSSTGTTAIPGTSTWTTLLSFTAVRAGSYQVAGGFYGTCNAGGAGSFLLGVGLNGAVQASTAELGSVAAGGTFTLTGVPFVVTATAGQVINLMGFSNQTSTGPNETMSIVPLRVT